LFFKALSSEVVRSSKFEQECKDVKRKLDKIEENREEERPELEGGKDIECECSTTRNVESYKS